VAKPRQKDHPFHRVLAVLLAHDGQNVTRTAYNAGLKPSTVSTWQNRGSLPSVDEALKLCDYFNVSLRYLMTGEDFFRHPRHDVQQIIDMIDRFSAEDILRIQGAIACTIAQLHQMGLPPRRGELFSAG